jgi:hypothetical protein
MAWDCGVRSMLVSEDKSLEYDILVRVGPIQ